LSANHREFPQAPDAERAVLSSILLSPRESLHVCTEKELTKGAFYLPAHAEIYETLTTLSAENKPLDFITVAESLRDRNMLDAVGGPAYLNELFVLLPSAANVGFYVELLLSKAILRNLIGICTDATENAYEGDTRPSELVSDIHARIGSLIHRKSSRKTVKETLQEIVDEVREGKDDTGLVFMPVQGINGRLKLYLGDLLMITAPTSCGKTALAAQIAMGIAGAGKRVALYPLEMAQEQVLKRSIAQAGGHNADFVRKLVKDNAGNPPSEFVKKTVKDFMETAREIGKMDIHMRDDLSRWDQIRADIRMEHAIHPFTFILIDYLQLIQTSGKHERRQLAIAEITQGAKLLAGELQCVICMPSQVNKDGGTREAQDAENDASALLKIHPLEGKDEPEPGRVTVWKQREGKRHLELPLRFNPDLTRFDYAPEDSQ